jgi:pyridoxine 5-phosphate synthase
VANRGRGTYHRPVLPKLSVNINKYALLRNSRGNDQPNLRNTIDMCVEAGAHGITVHPRRDQRHVRFDDVPTVAAYLRDEYPGIEYNVECEDASFLIDIVVRDKPDQCTLVPVNPGELTSDHGFTPDAVERLKPTVARLKEAGIRVSLFVDCVPDHVRALAATGADRVELYTGPFAGAFGSAGQAMRTAEAFRSAEAAAEVGLGLNAGHDLDRHNLAALRDLPGLREVSIGHALVCRALEVGTAQAIKELLAALGHA